MSEGVGLQIEPDFAQIDFTGEDVVHFSKYLRQGGTESTFT